MSKLSQNQDKWSSSIAKQGRKTKYTSIAKHRPINEVQEDKLTYVHHTTLG